MDTKLFHDLEASLKQAAISKGKIAPGRATELRKTRGLQGGLSWRSGSYKIHERTAKNEEKLCLILRYMPALNVCMSNPNRLTGKSKQRVQSISQTFWKSALANENRQGFA